MEVSTVVLTVIDSTLTLICGTYNISTNGLRFVTVHDMITTRVCR